MPNKHWALSLLVPLLPIAGAIPLMGLHWLIYVSSGKFIYINGWLGVLLSCLVGFYLFNRWGVI